MNIHELDSYNLGDAVKFHRRLNPRIWGRDEHLLPEVREKLLTIAENFQEFLGVEDLNVRDITISGSNAAYSYTKNSDIDLHLVVAMPADPVYQELFNAKKYQYNDEHNIKIGGADVELYVQPADQPHISQGIYSVQDNDWISIPQRKRARVDDACVRDKVSDLDARIHDAVRSGDESKIATLADKIKAMRQVGLEQHGEFGCENLAFKMLRNSGCIKLLWDARRAAQDRELSLRETNQPQQRFRYGFSEGMQSQPYSTSDGVAASTKQFLEDADNSNDIVQDFIQQVTTELGIDPVPEIHLHTDPDWSENNHSFGRYDPESHTLNVSMPNRHVMDVLRTVAHELVHCSQNQQHGQLPDDAGETGSRWENDANARAGVIMRDWANSHPEHFAHDALEEGASGYIPKNKKEAAMPQYAMALSVDIKPGQTGKEANKLALNTGRNGEPGLLMKTVNLREYKMPQPSQGPGQYRDLNEPLGPETPPRMPAGTIKVDVSDTQDWYQLGQDISNLDIANKAHYNQGPPHTVLAFGSEDLEHMYIQQLKRLGLNTHDLDEPGEDDLDEGINEGNQLTLRDFVVTVSPHALSQAHNKGVDVHMVDDILRNISKVKDNIMSLEPGRALILHNGQGTGLGVRRGQGNNLTLATVFPTNPGFRKGKHPTFQVEANEVDEGVKSALATAALAGTMAMGAQAKAPEMVHQTVEPGDTVYSIARQNNVNPLEIYRLNKMDRSTKLEIGQKVLVPDYSKPISKMPATVTPTIKQPPVAQPPPTLKDKISSIIPKFSSDNKEEQGVTLLSDNTDAEAALQTAAKAAGLTGVELAQFMAQTRHESWDFGKMKEVGNKKQFAKYDAPRKARQLGNKVRGDGERFKGRGFIQLTGRDNYTRASQQIFGDDRLVKNPDLASRLDVGAQIALWFWKNQVRPNVSNFNNTKEVTNAINPGLSGLQDRHTKFKEYMAVL
jgi:putative chitinase